MKKSKITADYLAARAKTAATVMQATGWAEGQINAELLGVDSVFVRVFAENIAIHGGDAERRLL